MPRDKWLHVAAGVLAFVFGWLMVGPWFGALLAVLAAVGREAWQLWTGRGVVDAWDAIATAAPGVLLWLMVGTFDPYGAVGAAEVGQPQDLGELGAQRV